MTWLADGFSLYLMGMWLPTYPVALLLCLVFRTALIAGDREKRAAATLLGFSVWFALQWAIVIALFGQSFAQRDDLFGVALVSLFAVTELLFVVCAVGGLVLFADGIGTNSSLARWLVAFLVLAHVFHVALIFFGTVLAL